MGTRKQLSLLALGLLLFSPPASANVIIPAIMGSWFLMIVALVPVVLIEALVLSLGFGYSGGVALRASFWTNFSSTIVGIPVATILLSLFRDRPGVPDSIDKFATRFDTRWKQIRAAIFIVPFGYEGDGPRSEEDWKAFAWVEPVSEFVILMFFFLCSWVIEALIASRFNLLSDSRFVLGMLAANAVSYTCVYIWFIKMHVSNMRQSLLELRKTPLPTLKAQKEAALSEVENASPSANQRAA